MRNPALCICKNKDADQLRGNPATDQRICFRYIYRKIPLLPKSKISSFRPSSVAVQPSFCRTWSNTPKTGFLVAQFIIIAVAYIPQCLEYSAELEEFSTPCNLLHQIQPVYTCTESTGISYAV